jgi:hypothetical protein
MRRLPTSLNTLNKGDRVLNDPRRFRPRIISSKFSY